eukprot:COSAG03_NODE_3485_length_1986_cov_4.533121_5_plen_54_part_01
MTGIRTYLKLQSVMVTFLAPLNCSDAGGGGGGYRVQSSRTRRVTPIFPGEKSSF